MVLSSLPLKIWSKTTWTKCCRIVSSSDEKFVIIDMDIFRTSCWSGAPANIAHLKIDLTVDVTLVRVRLRNYSQKKRDFL